MLRFRRHRQGDAENPSRESSLKDINNAEKNDTKKMWDVAQPSAEGGALTPPPRSEVTAESPTSDLSNHNSQRQTAPTPSCCTDVFRDPSSGLPYLWNPNQYNVPSSTPSISSSEIPWQLSIVHHDVHGDPGPSQEGWSNSEELAPLCSPVVL